MPERAPRTAAATAGSAAAALVGLSALSLVVLPAGCRPASPRELRPDVLLVTVDTLRADYLGSYGFPFETTPEIDALAAQGALFERAIAASGRTVPAHASIMTSRYPRSHSVGFGNGTSTLQDQETLADRFAGAGYATAGFVGNILLTRKTGLGRGFAHFDDDVRTPELNRSHVVERLADDTTRAAIAWLAEDAPAASEGPIFLWVHYQDPHGPYTPPPELEGRFELPPRPGEGPLPVARWQPTPHIPSYQALPGLYEPYQYRSRYAEEIHFADGWIGKLLAAFERRAADRPGVVLVTADHGESMGEQGRYFVHTGGTDPDVAHVPLVIRAPGIRPQRRPELVSHVDVLPTLLELAGLPLPEDAQGVSLVPLLRAGEPLPDRFVFTDVGERLSAYRGTRVLELRGVEGAWHSPAEPEPGAVASQPSPAPRLQWRPLLWEGDRFQADGPTDVPLPDAVLAYARSAQPMALLPPLPPETIEQLEALGYGSSAPADSEGVEAP